MRALPLILLTLLAGSAAAQVRPASQPPAASRPTSASASLRPAPGRPTATPAACRQTCARDRYACQLEDEIQACGSAWSRCVAACPRG